MLQTLLVIYTLSVWIVPALFRVYSDIISMYCCNILVLIGGHSSSVYMSTKYIHHEFIGNTDKLYIWLVNYYINYKRCLAFTNITSCIIWNSNKFILVENSQSIYTMIYVCIHARHRIQRNVMPNTCVCVCVFILFKGLNLNCQCADIHYISNQ